VFESRSRAATQKLGARLGAGLAGGELLALSGDLGAGKTAFVQGLARGLGVTSARVASPTFTIVNEHPGRVPLIHVDLYRIADPSELEEIGLRDYLGRAAVVAIEWFERAFEFLPAERLEIRIVATSATTRRLEARAVGATAVARLRAWMG
jgi:tRNA threonylcarbamoyladenosine biosynthesis protein TsaE